MQQEESITSSCPQVMLDTQTDEELLDVGEEDVQEDNNMGSDDDTWQGKQQLSPCSSVPLSSQDQSSPSTIGRIFMVEKLVKAAGGHRPSILFDGRLLDVAASRGGAGSVVLLQVPGGKELQLSLRYEPPSPKFSRSCPGMTSYRCVIVQNDPRRKGARQGFIRTRLKLLQGSHFLYMLRGLPQEAILDTAAKAVSWGTLHLVFQTCHQLDSFLAVLKHVQIVPGQVWPDKVAALWSTAQDASTGAQLQAAAAVQRSASILRDSMGSMSGRQRKQGHAGPPPALTEFHVAGVQGARHRRSVPSRGAWQAACSFVQKHALVASMAAATCLLFVRSRP